MPACGTGSRVSCLCPMHLLRPVLSILFPCYNEILPCIFRVKFMIRCFGYTPFSTGCVPQLLIFHGQKFSLHRV